MADRSHLSGSDRARALLEGVRARLWLVVLGPVVGLAVVAGASLVSSGAGYRAQAELQFDPSPPPAALTSLGFRGAPAPGAREVLSDTVFDAYRTQILKAEAADPRAELSVASPGPDGATIVAEGEVAEDTRKLANDWARAVVAARATQQSGRIQAVRQALDRQIAAAEADPLGAERRAQLVDSRSRLEVAQRALGPDARVGRVAGTAVRDGSDDPYLLGALIGLVAGLALALAAALLDRRLRTPQTLAAAFGLPLLGRLGRGRGGSGGGGTGGGGNGGGGTGGAGSSRLLARLLTATGGQQPPTLLVTGVSATTDTAFAAHAMATAISDGGKSVALVGWTPGGGAAYASEDGPLTVAEESAGWPDFLLRVAEHSFNHDVVVVCAPPVTESPDTLAAADALGAWFVCAQVGATRTDDAVAVSELRSPPAGLIALAAPESRLRPLLVEERDGATGRTLGRVFAPCVRIANTRCDRWIRPVDRGRYPSLGAQARRRASARRTPWAWPSSTGLRPGAPRRRWRRQSSRPRTRPRRGASVRSVTVA